MPREYNGLDEDIDTVESGKALTKYVKLPYPTAIRAVAQAKRLGISLSAYIRMAVVKYTEEEERNSEGK